MIRFGLPALLGALLAVPALAAILVWGLRRRAAAERRFAGSGLVLLRSGSIAPGRRRFKAALVLLVAALLAFALARPQIGQTSVVLPREGSDVVIALDVSNSMAAGDVKPTRLDRAKGAAGALIDHLGGDRVGLVVFAGSANARFPLTTDGTAARQVVEGVAIKDTGLKAGTDIAGAIATARGILTGDKTRGKVIVLISDGEDLSGNDLAAVKDAAGAGLIVHTIGVGTAQGGQVFAVDTRTGRGNQARPVIDPATGQTAVSYRDDGNLRSLAAAGNGTAYDGNTTDFAFDLSGSIDRLAKTRFASGATTTPIERFQIPLALALALLLADTLLAETVARRQARSRPRAAAGATNVETERRPVPTGAVNRP